MCGPVDNKISNSNNDVKGNSPQILLAIIQEGVNSPSQEMVKNFEKILNRIRTAYPEMKEQDIADKLTLAWDLARKEGYKETILQFSNELITSLQSLTDAGSTIEFEELLTIM